MKRKTRAQMRGKPLDDDCKKYSRPDSGQFGPEDKRCFCTGIWNKMYEEYERKCIVCPAWASNACAGFRMSIIIRGMNMPAEREGVDVRIFRDGTGIVTEERAHREECKVVYLPPHGRLVDADALLASDLGGEPFKSVIRRVLMQAPTVIEGERATDGIH